MSEDGASTLSRRPSPSYRSTPSRWGSADEWKSYNLFLTRWLMRKHKRLAGHKTRAVQMLKRLAESQPKAFLHWKLGYLS